MAYFEPIRNIILYFVDININEVAYKITQDRKTKELIIELNTRKQLFDKGVDADGKRLSSIGGGYTDFTIMIKRESNLPEDRVTLFQTGDFYSSFRIKPYRGGFTIEANTIKDGEDLQDRYGRNILGLNEESRKTLVEYYLKEIQKQIQERINNL